VRPFKGLFCDDISEFESYHPSHAVGLPELGCELEFPRALVPISYSASGSVLGGEGAST
jgi:hypothetical protein